jgi:excisionase family DNA binding protein
MPEDDREVPLPQLLNAAEAAAYLNVPLSTLRNQKDAWGLTYLRTGRSLKFPLGPLREWVRERGTEPPGDDLSALKAG